MTTEKMARWSVLVSKETDLALRSFLGARGGRKGDLSKFIEEAVLSRMAYLNQGETDVGVAASEREPENAMADVRPEGAG